METAKSATAKEIKDKYGSYPFSSEDAGRSIILNRLYINKQVQENKEEAEPLYPNQSEIESMVHGTDDCLRYMAHAHLLDWTLEAHKTAVYILKTIRDSAAALHNTLAAIMAGEQLSALMSNEQKKGEEGLWLRTVSLWKYGPQESGYYAIDMMRTSIRDGLRYLKAYNTLIGMIADEMTMPEFTFYQVHLEGVSELLSTLNESMCIIRDHAQEYRQRNSESGTEEKFDQFTPEYLAETMEAFEPISSDAEPIPEEKLRFVHGIMARCFTGKDLISWPRLFYTMTTGYWM